MKIVKEIFVSLVDCRIDNVNQRPFQTRLYEKFGERKKLQSVPYRSVLGQLVQGDPGYS